MLRVFSRLATLVLWVALFTSSLAVYFPELTSTQVFGYNCLSLAALVALFIPKPSTLVAFAFLACNEARYQYLMTTAGDDGFNIFYGDSLLMIMSVIFAIVIVKGDIKARYILYCIGANTVYYLTLIFKVFTDGSIPYDNFESITAAMDAAFLIGGLLDDRGGHFKFNAGRFFPDRWNIRTMVHSKISMEKQEKG
jgi:hypothetical protein